MDEKKVVSRNVVVGVGALCAVLLFALGYSVVNYSSVLRDKESLIASLNAQIVDLGGVPSQVPGISDKDAQIAALLNQLAEKSAELEGLSAPKLVAVDLKAEDNRLNLNTPYVHVYGYVVNVGNDTAENCRIHVVLQQTGGVVAEDTYVTLGSLVGESFASVDTKIYYEGSEIVTASMNLEWS